MMKIHISNEQLGRDVIENNIVRFLNSFDEQCKNVHFKKGIYLYGSPGSGKTHFITHLLKKMNYDIIHFDAGDVRNKSLIDTITSNNMSKKNVLDMLNKKEKKIAIVMDEIDGMNNGDKGGITSLIKLIRQKKTKKQKLENVSLNPIICIGNYFVDKKIKELIKVCDAYELKTPTFLQINQILMTHAVDLENDPRLKTNVLQYIQGDIRKLLFIIKIQNQKKEMLNNDFIENILRTKLHNEDSKQITQSLINHLVSIDKHNHFMNETDRTIVSLLFHENIVDCIKINNKEKMLSFYLKILENICFADYIDRITFQNQIWIFNEMSSLIKLFYNNKLFHDEFPEKKNILCSTEEVRFTKILTKYSTEYNNQQFIYHLCQKLNMDKKDVIACFQEIRLKFGDCFYEKNETLNKVEKMLETHEISKLDIKRMYRFLDKNVKKCGFDEDELVNGCWEEEEEEGEIMNI